MDRRPFLIAPAGAALAAPGVRVLKAETARLARSNLLPAGVVYPGGGGFGAGARVVLLGGASRFGSPGTFGWAGAAGTVWWIDPASRGNTVFMTQFMPPNSYPVQDEVSAAIEADLNLQRVINRG